MATRRRRRAALPLPLLIAQLNLAAWETIARRLDLVARGTCSPAEYRRMVAEKAAAAGLSMRALSRHGDPAALLAPWHRRAVANAKRLRRK